MNKACPTVATMAHPPVCAVFSSLKPFDKHAPFGPWITTADEVGDPRRLGVRRFDNGEKRQDSNTSHFALNLWDQVEHVPNVMTLEPR